VYNFKGAGRSSLDQISDVNSAPWSSETRKAYSKIKESQGSTQQGSDAIPLEHYSNMERRSRALPTIPHCKRPSTCFKIYVKKEISDLFLVPLTFVLDAKTHKAQRLEPGTRTVPQEFV